MTGRIDLDHTSFAVHDALGWAKRLRRDLGAEPVYGEEFEEFRYLQLRIGPIGDGATLELLEPVGEGFLTRFLAKHGEGPHHLTFLVPELEAVVAETRAAGLTVVGERYDDPLWREAFIVPDEVHGVVVQLAQTDEDYPPIPEWWGALRDVAAGPAARLGMTHLASTDLAASQRLFSGLLQARAREFDGGIDFEWPRGTVRVRAATRAGVIGMALRDSSVGDMEIGAARLGDLE